MSFLAEIMERLFGVLGHRWFRGRFRDLVLGTLLLIAVFNWGAFQTGLEAVIKSGACTAAHRYAALLPSVTAADSAVPTMSYTVAKTNGFCTIVPKELGTSTAGLNGTPGNATQRLPSEP